MLIRDGLRSQLWQLIPKRNFHLLLDPECLGQLKSPHYSEILQLVIDLRLFNPAINIQLMTSDKQAFEEPLFEICSEVFPAEAYVPNRLDKDDPRNGLLEISLAALNKRTLCALAVGLKVDGLVTTSATLIGARYALSKDLINIIPLDELADFVEVCAHGHNVFVSASHSSSLYQDVYYILAHHKGKRLATWWGAGVKAGLSEEGQQQLRSLVLNRYPFVLYARDMVKFYRLLGDDSRRHGDSQFGFGLSYHLNQFYFLLWGMLDQLSLLANHSFGLGLSQIQCGISRPNFLTALAKRSPNLRRFFLMPTVENWIGLMSDFRHSAAHQVIPMPTEVVVDTEDSKKTREEILNLLELEDPDFGLYRESSMGDEGKKWFEEQAVSRWRHSKMERLADHMIYIKKGEGSYLRSPVVNIDYDLSMLTGVMDAFLVAMFSNRNGNSASDA